MRLFVAIDIPKEIRDTMRALLDRLRPIAKINWTPPDNLHITTKFIGEWPEARLDEVKTVLSGIQSQGSIQIGVRNIGWFPNPKRPHVLWAGIEAGANLAELAFQTSHAVATLGIAEEDRPYSPHLTLARIREAIPLTALRSALDAFGDFDFGSFNAHEFFLYQMLGGRYIKLAAYSL